MSAIAYPHRAAGSCASGAYRDLLEHHRLSFSGRPLSEGMVFGLGGGLHLGYVEAPGGEIDPPLYLIGRSEGLERDVCSHLGIDLEVRRGEDPEAAWEWVREEVDAGRPTMVWADIKELSYQDVRMSNTKHAVTVLGYDTERGIALVADHDFEQPQECTLESLTRARSSHGFPGPQQHATWIMRFPERLPDPAEAVATGVGRCVHNMREDLPPEGAPYSLGLTALAEFAESYPLWPERFGGLLENALRGLRVFIVKAGTDGTFFRSLQATFLAEAAGLLRDPALLDAARLYTELGECWVELAGAVRSGGPQPAHEAGLPHVARAASLEREAVDALATWLVANGVEPAAEPAEAA
jgi:hypothetical protein